MKRLALFAAAGLIACGLLVVGWSHLHDVEAQLASPADGGDGRSVTVRFVKNPSAAPDVTLQDLDGKRLTSAEWRGKVTLINFWATWCPPCRAEIPELVALQEKYRDNLQIIGVSMDETSPDAVKAFAVQHQINYPIVMATPELQKGFPGVFALPTTFVVDPQGRIVQKHVGLVNASIYEDETRVLAGLIKNPTIETVEDAGQVLLANAANATELPGLDLTKLPPDKKREALQQLNADQCSCGCELTLAQCRINDPDCKISLPLAQTLVKKIASS